MSISEPEDQIVISGDDARGGVTGHNVRYVLLLGIAGVISGFAVLAAYSRFDVLKQKMAALLSLSPGEVIAQIAPYAAIALIGGALAAVLLSLVTLAAGRSGNASQFGMRLRVIAQFALICVIMAMFYVSATA